MNVCQWCDTDYTPTRAHQRFCSLKCNALHREHSKRAANPPPQPRPTSRWQQYPSSTPTRAGAHQRLRRMLLPQAIGQACQLCGHVMTNDQPLALDHVVPMALGGQTTLANVRIVHYRCNHQAGSRLGRTLQQRADRSQNPPRAV